MSSKIRVVVVEDREPARDALLARLSTDHGIEVAGATRFGHEIEQILSAGSVDAVLLNARAAASPTRAEGHALIDIIPDLLDTYPQLALIIISDYRDPGIVQSVMDAGARAYVHDDDASAIANLPTLVRSVVQQSVYVSEMAPFVAPPEEPLPEVRLTGRQTEVLNIYLAHPEYTTERVARLLGVKNSTVRNLLSAAYLRLHVPNRAAAVARAQKLGLLRPARKPARLPKA